MSNEVKDDPYSLKVKAEFLTELVTTTSTSAPAPSITDDSSSTPAVAVSLSEKVERDNKDDDKRSDRKKRRGRNKKRPRDTKIDSAIKACMATMKGDVCPFGANKCKYSHDLKELLSVRKPDITEVDSDENGIRCPRYRLFGTCEFGVTCRVGAEHINQATGENIRKDADDNDAKDVKNILTKDLQSQLRKKTYPFLCKRYDAKDKAKQDEETVNTPALELKERKLIDFSNKVYVAPLTTVGNLPFRRIMKGFGADITCGEMAVGTCLLEGKSSEWALLKRHACEDIFGVQVAAGYADQATRVAELIEGHCEVDFVDMNLGCPLDLICDKGAGATLMMRDNKLKGILGGLSTTLSCPFTIKIRTGWDEGKPFAHKLIPKVQSWGIDGLNAIMIHGRSRLQRYSRLADWDYISQVATSQSNELPKIPIIGNGDIFSFSDYQEKIEKGGVNATAMLGRGALIKPWLPTEIKESRHWDISATERFDVLKDFVKFGLEHWGSDDQGVNTTRRFLLEWLSFLYRYVPVGMLEVLPQQMNMRPPTNMCGRSDLETLMMSPLASDWVKLSERLLGKVVDDFKFEPKHKANSYSK